ncbi:MAG: PQQ-binding-like beta-propeller repeat protein [Anaerolineae bacterium]|nr:PQQ-binding-like beta-propeller repeat protein [Anaerolineae bacterium]
MKRRTKYYMLMALIVLLALLAGCSSDNNISDQQQQPNATPVSDSPAWQRPQAAISQELFAQVRLTGVMQLHQQTVNGVAFSRNGTRLASAGADDITAVWNLANGEALFVRGDNDGRRVFFGPEDNTVITVNRDGSARVWSMDMSPPRELEEITSFDGYDAPTEIVVQSADRTMLAFGSRSGWVRLWRMPEVEVINSIRVDNRYVQYLAFSPDGTLLAAIGADFGARIWSIPDGELVYDELAAPRTKPLHMTFSPDSKLLAITKIGSIDVWDLETGEPVYSITTLDYAAAGEVAFSPDGTLLAGCGSQSVVDIWDAATGDALGGLPLPETVCANIAFSPDSKLLLTLPSPGQNVYLWDITHITDDVPFQDKQLRRRDRQNMGLLPGTRFYDFVWSEDGRFIVLLDELGPLYMLSAAE